MSRPEIKNLKRRLEHCGLAMIENASPTAWGTVATIGQFKISHSHNYYWVVNGDMPLVDAQKLYADPAGRDLIRVAGNCTCPAPEAPWLTWYDTDGTEVITKEQWKDFERLPENSDARKRLYDKAKRTYRVEDNQQGVAQAYVTQYHIDNDLGLRVFVDLVKSRLEFYDSILPFKCTYCGMQHASKFAGATGPDISDLPVRCYSVINEHRCVGNIVRKTP